MGMLIFTRRVGETEMIVVPPNQPEAVIITITVLSVKGNQVRIGTDAPMSVAVDREEVYNRKKQDKAEENAKRQFQGR